MANNQLTPPNSQRPNPYSLAMRFGDLVRTLMVVLFWILVAVTGCATAYVALRGLLWGVRLVLQAVGEA